jgi:cbb3-type cytochrome oxidase subunit 3
MVTLNLSASAIFTIGFALGFIAGVGGLAVMAFVYGKKKK